MQTYISYLWGFGRKIAGRLLLWVALPLASWPLPCSPLQGPVPGSPLPGPLPGASHMPLLGSAHTFAVLAATAVVNSRPTAIFGDVGVSPGGTVTGFPPGEMKAGSIHPGDAVAAQAHADLAQAYGTLVRAKGCQDMDGRSLGGTLPPGVYAWTGDARIDGTLVLDTGGDPDATFVLRIGGTLATAPGASVQVANDPGPCPGARVFWQVGDSVTIGEGSAFKGRILALGSITLESGAALAGSACSIAGGVTLAGCTVSICQGKGSIPRPLVKVEGEGRIQVPDPDSGDPANSGRGIAEFSFQGDPLSTDGSSMGRFRYLNVVTGRQVEGPITGMEVITLHPDGTAWMVRLWGDSEGDVPKGRFCILVERNGSGRDRFGLMVVARLPEARSCRTLAAGQVRFTPR